MSHDSVAFEVMPTQQPVTPRERVAPIPELHPRLCEQLAQARLAAAGALELTHLLPLVSAYYELIDDERRGIVRSMQLIADEARSFGDGLAGADAGHLQAIIDHIKDVGITVGGGGSTVRSKYSIRPASGYSAIRAPRSLGGRLRGCCRSCRCMGRSSVDWNRSPHASRRTAAICVRASSTRGTRTATCFRPS